MVPCALVSRGIISTRIEGSFHFGRTADIGYAGGAGAVV
jgi:hypothetical protein